MDILEKFIIKDSEKKEKSVLGSYLLIKLQEGYNNISGDIIIV